MPAPLSYYFSYGDVKVVEYLVTEANCDVNSENNKGETPLDIARR